MLDGPPLLLPNGRTFDPSIALEVLDRHGLPDGYPFVLDDDGTADGCRYLNRYLLEAWQQRGLTLDTMRKTHIRFLTRFLRFIRVRHAQVEAAAQEQDLNIWLADHGEPTLDLTDVTRDDLFEYRKHRQNFGIKGSTLNNELSALSGFYRYALDRGWITTDPVPRWGTKKRNTLITRSREQRVEKFLTLPQAKHFLEVGLRGDGADQHRPAYPERDYGYGLLLLTTGMRREEAGHLLDCEVQPLEEMPPSGVDSFRRTGKYQVIRDVYITTEFVNGLHLYRTAERPTIIAAAQPSLREKRRAGQLLVVDRIGHRKGQPTIVIRGTTIPAVEFSIENRRRAVRIADDGTIEPLALFLSRRGLPPHIDYWDHLFTDARQRVHDHGSALRPPAHVHVTPHTMRHTFAVHCLSELMRSAQGRALDPYALVKNPVETVRQLLGHASIETTQKYIYAAEIWQEEAPSALRRVAEAVTSGLAKPEDLQSPSGGVTS
ncbi:hypothetical protein AVL61_05025 [Kocuria rosea subsp. polaris]|uniref:Integrase n=1 Tax=Kocuria rosea subsp. polaris TaxID=136273 RepID=A0A0W8I7X9_KOCRO|nr:hypothetical protein AVL61_05025 [Kocuria polaris]